ncbi:dihydropyrimidinase [Trichuris suis]|nr:dihydropyrimidinase [Trichuris suis]
MAFRSIRKETAPILLKGGHVINDDSILVADILIRGGKIAQIAKGIQCQDARVIDIEGKCVMPGGIDSHTHFECQSMGIRSVDDFATGTKAALAGGTTMIINCVDSATSESLMSSFEKWKKQADQQVYCDYAFSVTVPKWSESSAKDMAELVKSHGVNSFKFSTASKNAPMLNDCELYEALKHCRQLGALARIHAEHGDLISMKEEELLTCQHLSIPEAFLQARPEQLEADCAFRACSISQLAGCPLNLPFVLNKQVAKTVADMKNKGVIVFGETTSACLAVNGNNYFHPSLSHAAAHVTSPPLRPDPTIGNGMIRRLASGELDMVSSGHCAFNNEQRSKTASGFGKIPQGVTGVEERMMILWQKGVNTGMLDPMRFVAVSSSNAAKLFNLYPSKGRIAVDSDADLVVWDPFAEKILSAQNQWSKVDSSIYEGVKCIGMPVMTIAGGRIAFEEGQVKVPAGSGKYINVAPFCPLAFSRIVTADAIQVITTMNNFEGPPLKVIPFVSNQEFHTRPITMAGSRNMLDSSFTISGAQFDDSDHQKRTTPSKHPFVSDQEFHTRPLTKAGGRNMFDSSFALSGAQVDDTQHQKRMTRITKPPGGDSHGLW